MVHREAGLVQHVADLEAKMQKFIAGGKNVTEEEICRKDPNQNQESTFDLFSTSQVKGPAVGTRGGTTPLKRRGDQGAGDVHREKSPG